MRISDWSSDVCSSDLPGENLGENCLGLALRQGEQEIEAVPQGGEAEGAERAARKVDAAVRNAQALGQQAPGGAGRLEQLQAARRDADSLAERRSEERRVGQECGRTWRSRWSPYH